MTTVVSNPPPGFDMLNVTINGHTETVDKDDKTGLLYEVDASGSPTGPAIGEIDSNGNAAFTRDALSSDFGVKRFDTFWTTESGTDYEYHKGSAQTVKTIATGSPAATSGASPAPTTGASPAPTTGASPAPTTGATPGPTVSASDSFWSDIHKYELDNPGMDSIIEPIAVEFAALEGFGADPSPVASPAPAGG